ncbi:MAG: TIGR01777 family oxidoreductase [Acidobacteriales bacterium]|nr:TIGR01777 family oxidoreductase [Terriglobales bacterium]
MGQIALTGSNGLIGTALRREMEQRGWRVLLLTRKPPAQSSEIRWDPTGQTPFSPDAIARINECDAVVHLAGENVAGGYWTQERMRRIRDSRVVGTRTLVAALCAADKAPTFISASAVGFYGNRGDELLDESSRAGAGFLAEVCQEWEAAATEAQRCGARTVITRFGVVLARHGGALAKMLPAFRLGLGARLGSGAQWVPWVSLEDAVRALLRLIENSSASGEYNITAPEPVTQREFADELASALRRPRLAWAPSPLLRLLAGKMADEALLASERVLPKRLQAEGFVFKDASLASTLRRILR